MKADNCVTYTENFALDLSSPDVLDCDGIDVSGGVLRGFAEYKPVDNASDYLGIVGVTSSLAFAHSNKNFRKYDGEKVTSVMTKMPMIKSPTEDARYDVFRDVAYMAFDTDGVLKYDASAASPAARWGSTDNALDVAIVNERMTILFNNGKTLRFAPSGERLYSDREVKYTLPSIDLPSSVQAICRYNLNVLYALGQSCYKVTFSANEQDIKITAVADSLSKVIPHSVVKIGGKIIFATGDGLYALANDKVSRIFRALDGVIEFNDSVRASVWRGKYVLTIPYGSGRRAYVLDADNETCAAALYNDIVDICVYNGADMAVTTDGKWVKSVKDEYHPARFVRDNIGFKSARSKFLRRMVISTKYDVTVTLTNELGKEIALRVKGGDKPQSLRIFGKGRVFRLEICSIGQMEVSELKLVAETCKEVNYVG